MPSASGGLLTSFFSPDGALLVRPTLITFMCLFAATEKFFHRHPKFFTYTLRIDRRPPGCGIGPRNPRSLEAGVRDREGTLRTRRCHRRTRRSYGGGGTRRARSANRHRGRGDARSRVLPGDPTSGTPSL